jgi:hypothetical protein
MKTLPGGNLRIAEGVYIEEHEMDRFTSTCNVFARAKPEDKLQIVNSLQRQGETNCGSLIRCRGRVRQIVDR